MIPKKLLIEMTEEMTRAMLDMDKYLDRSKAASIKKAIFAKGFEENSKQVVETMSEDLTMKLKLRSIEFTGQLLARGVGFSNQPGEQMIVVIMKKMEKYKFHVLQPKSFLSLARNHMEYQLLCFEKLIEIIEKFQ